MGAETLADLGLTENEIKIYYILLKAGSLTAYELAKKTGIYRTHVYDKLGKLMEKGLVSQVYEGSRKIFRASDPEKLRDFVEAKKADLEKKEESVEKLILELNKLGKQKVQDTSVEIFTGKEGVKYFIRDVLKEAREVLVTGIDDEKYKENLGIFMEQYFRDLRKLGIKERVITIKKLGVFMFDKKTAPTTEYRFLEQEEFNPTNTFIYSDKVVIVTWGTPVTAIMIKNNKIAETYKSHFEHLWSIATKEN